MVERPDGPEERDMITDNDIIATRVRQAERELADGSRATAAMQLAKAGLQHLAKALSGLAPERGVEISGHLGYIRGSLMAARMEISDGDYAAALKTLDRAERARNDAREALEG